MQGETSWWRKRDQLWLLLFVVSLASSEVAASQIGDVIGGFYKTISEQNFDLFEKVLLKASWVVFIVAVCKSVALFAQEMTALVWRAKLVEHLHGGYISQHRGFYCILKSVYGIDNPDQRITQDVTQLTTAVALILSKGLVSPFLVLWYSYVLFQTFGWVAPVTCYGYFILGALCNAALGHRVIPWVYKQEKLEGDFRYNHVWLRTNAEAVALHDGHVAEQLRFSTSFREVADNSCVVSLKRLPLYVSIQLFDYLGSIVNYAALGFVILQWKSSGKTEAEIAAVIGSGTYSCLYLISAFSTMLDLAQTCANALAFSSRVAELSRGLEGVEREASGSAGRAVESREDSPLLPAATHPYSEIIQPDELDELCFAAEDATVVAPGGGVLVRGLELRIGAGEDFLISGRSGVGKSALVRGFAGLWQPESGTLRGPPGDVVCYLPQSPYLFRGSLLEQLTYPAKFLRHLPAHQPPQTGLRLTEELEALLARVGLAHLPHRAGGWHEAVDWPSTLSRGEQQRLALARLLRSRPVFAVLDEATSAIEIEAEDAIYVALKEAGITLVSIGHRGSIAKHHRYRLEIVGDGQGSWSIEEL